MANPLHHAISSAKRYGGHYSNYLELHEWFDESKAWIPDFRHRAMRHHSEGIAEAVKLFEPIRICTRRCGACHGSGALAVDSLGKHGICIECDGMGLDEDGPTRLVPIRFVAEQHVREDLGRIPTAADWLRCMRPEGWMTRHAEKLSREVPEDGVTTDRVPTLAPTELALRLVTEQPRREHDGNCNKVPDQGQRRQAPGSVVGDPLPRTAQAETECAS